MVCTIVIFCYTITSMTIPKKTLVFLEITGLAVITVLLAGVLLFFPKLTNAPKNEDIPTKITPTSVATIDNLSNNDRVLPEQVITGTVPGFWFFEGSFPVTLRDINGNTITTITATTTEDWMVTSNVHFTVTLPETFTYTGVGSILFKKDDPSDGEAPFNSETDQYSIPVIFEND